MSEAENAYQRVSALFEAGMYPRALAEAEEALASSPDDAWLHAVRSDLLGLTDRPDAALPGARHAVSLAPDLAYAHRVLAEALIDSDQSPRQAVEAASQAVRLEPSADAYYTLVRALLGQWRGTRRAAEVARILGQEYPQSVLAPLAMALVALRRSGVYIPEGGAGPVILVVVIVTRGGALIGLVLMWLFNAIRRIPYLRQADAHLRRALQMDPSSPAARLLAADVLRFRYRFAQAVDQQVATAAINASLIDAGEVVKAIATRTERAALAAFAVWAVPGFVLHPLLAGGVTGPATAMAGVVLVGEFRRRQVASLPRPLRAQLDRQVMPVALSALLALLVTSTALVAHALDAYWRAGSVLSAAIAALAFLAATAIYIRGRLAHY